MELLIAGGTGLIGQALVKHFTESGHGVSVLGRCKTRIKNQFPLGVKPISWDELTLEDIDKQALIINLCGENAGKKRWSDERKQALFDSRIHPTETLASLCSQSNSKPTLFNASAIGIYGNQRIEDSPSTEQSPPPSEKERPFLYNLALAWEKSAMSCIDSGVRVVTLRFGVVLSPNGGVLKELKLPYQLGLAGPIGHGQQPFSWIALRDVVKAVDFLIEHPDITGPVNLVSPNPVTQKEFATSLAKKLRRPAFLPTFSWLIRLAFGQMGEELLLSGQNVEPHVLQENGFAFEFPDLFDALESMRL